MRHPVLLSFLNLSYSMLGLNFPRFCRQCTDGKSAGNSNLTYNKLNSVEFLIIILLFKNDCIIISSKEQRLRLQDKKYSKTGFYAKWTSKTSFLINHIECTLYMWCCWAMSFKCHQLTHEFALKWLQRLKNQCSIITCHQRSQLCPMTNTKTSF